MSPKAKAQNGIKFKQGLKIPTVHETRKALDVTSFCFDLRTVIKYRQDEEFLKLLYGGLFKPLAKPTDELDWLVQFRENAQTCDSFFNTSPYTGCNELGVRSFVYMIQIGDFEQFDAVYDYSKRFFTENTVKLTTLKIDLNFKKRDGKRVLIATDGTDKWILEHRFDKSTKQFQVLTSSFDKVLLKIKPTDACSIIGLTNVDLYHEETDLFIAGLCNWRLNVAVFSCFRYNPKIKFCEEKWYNIQNSRKITEATADKLLLMRTCKLMVHEICHLLGIYHCTYMDCCMNGSGHLQEDFKQSMFLCPVDLKKLTLIMNFDILERYKKLREFFELYKVKQDVKWLDGVIKHLEK